MADDDATQTPAVDETAPLAPPSEPAAKPPRRGRRRTPFVVGAIGGIAGAALVVVGALGYSSASDDDTATNEARRERRELEVQEQRASAERDALLDEARKLDDEVTALNASSVDLGEAEEAVNAALNAAVDLANAGSVGAAQTAYEAQAGPIADLNAKLTTARDSLARARLQLTALEDEAMQ